MRDNDDVSSIARSEPVYNSGISARRALVTAAMLIGALAFCIALVDRPTATWLHEHFAGRTWPFVVLTHIVDPLPPLATMAVVILALRAWSGRKEDAGDRTALLFALAVLLAMTLKEQAKFVFGRGWPETWVDSNPSWIATGTYGFFPLHGGRGWASFPSGHMTLMTAPVTALWRRFPSLRPVGVLLVAGVAIGLLGADYHFVGDLIGGILLGMGCGSIALILVDVARREPEPDGR